MRHPDRSQRGARGPLHGPLTGAAKLAEWLSDPGRSWRGLGV